MTARTLFLHAGPPKTGSTAIQQFFHRNQAVLAELGLYRPQTGTQHRGHYHFDLVATFEDPSASPLAASLESELVSAGLPERVFISAEHFAVRLAREDYLAGLLEFSGRLGYRLHVIAYIRPQAPLLNSLYSQSVKSWRQVKDMESFVMRELDSGRHDYARTFAPLLASNAASLSLRPFNRQTLAGGLTADMCEVMGISTEGVELAAAEEEANTSPGPKSVTAFQRLRRRAAEDYPQLDREALAPLTWPILRAAGALGWNDTKFGGIEDSLLNRIRTHYADSNEALAERAWGKPWRQVFAEAEELPPPFNTFHPPDAPQAERREFRDFLEDSAGLIAAIAADQKGQGPRR